MQVDGGNLPVGMMERREFTLSLTDDETMRKPRLPFWHIDYFTQPQLDDPDFFLVPDWSLPELRGPPEDVLGLPREAESAAVVVRPARLCPSPPLPPPEAKESQSQVALYESGSVLSSSSPPQSDVKDTVTSDASIKSPEKSSVNESIHESHQS